MSTTIGIPGIENGGVYSMVAIQAVVGPGSGGDGDRGVVMVVGGDSNIGGGNGFEDHVPPCREWEAHESFGHWEDWGGL